MIATRAIQNEIQAQKRIIARLKREIYGMDKTGKSGYIKDFVSEFHEYKRICTIESIINQAASCDVVYFGDYHPLDESQEWVLELMRELSSRKRKVVLALEMLYTHQQAFLDQWMKGRITEEEFLEAIDYRSEWGFSWESYKRLFMLAKDPFIPIFGIDSEPRNQLKHIRKRDRLIAGRIVTIRKFFPGHLILVMVGESHLASKHLPAEVRRVCDDGFRDLMIVQNVDEIYWRLIETGRADAEAVGIDGNRYCIFTTSPILKYQAYREIIDVWIEGKEGDRRTPALQDMVENMLLFLSLSKNDVKVTIREGWSETIEAVFPEIQFRRTYNSFASYLQSKRVGQFGIAAVLQSLRYFGSCYIPWINAFLVLKYDPVGAAREIARFLVYAMRDEIGPGRKRMRGDEDRFYAVIIEEALVYFGSKIINPKQNCMKSDLILQAIDSMGKVRGALPGFSLKESRNIVRLLKYHFRRERVSSGVLRKTRKLEEFFELGIKKRLLIVRTLGHTLGEAIYGCYHDGLVSREDILGLYGETFEKPGKAKGLYMKWVRETRPFRGGWGNNR